MKPIYKYYHNFLTEQECNYLIENNTIKLESAKISNNKKPSMLIRKSKVSWINKDVDSKSDEIIQKIVDLMFWESKETHDIKLTSVEPVQFAKYGLLDHYAKHIDIGTNDSNYRILSAVVELTNPNNYLGGGLNIYIANQVHKMPFKQGTVVLFPSILTHKAKPVFYGTRYSLSLWGCKT